MDRPYRLRARRIVLLYISFAAIWILGSDYLAEALVHVPGIHSFKGLAFVAATGAILYVILRRAESSMREFQANLMASREQFERVVENAPEAILIQAGGEIRYANPSALRLYGAREAGDLSCRPVLDLVAPEWHDDVLARVRQANEERSAPPVAEMQHRRLDGTLLDVEVSSSPFEYGGDKGSLVFVRDISERKAAQRHEEQLQEQVRQAQKMESIGLLAGGVAHDFNNLLTVVNGYADMLLLDLPERDPLAASVQEIRDAGTRAASLTRQLLAFSRKEIAEWTVLDLNAVVREMEKMLGRLVGDQIRIQTGLDDSIGPVLADASWMHQVLMNLLVNARDAMPSGGEIAIRTSREDVDERTMPGRAAGPYVRLSVTDTGAGMTPEVQARVFEPFYTTKPRGQGTGLGLSTVYGIVRQSGGWISVDSRPGEGTTMHVWLPEYGGAPLPGERAREGGEPLRGGETILVVEDDARVLKTAAAMLRQFGYSVLCAGGPEEALQAADRHNGRIHLLLSDVMMPEMTGSQLAGRLQARLPGLKAMLMSGYRADGAGQGAGFPFIPKPFTAGELARRVRAVLDAG